MLHATSENGRAPVSIRRCQGTTLMEVLIALLVLMGGFLAVAAMQSTSLKNNHSAHLRSLAVIQAHDMSDRMYANTAGVAAGRYNAIVYNPMLARPNCSTKLEPGSEGLSSINCTPAQLAQFDAWEWNAANAANLPTGRGTVTGPDGNGAYTITVSWVEQVSTGTATKSFSFQVKPLP